MRTGSIGPGSKFFRGDAVFFQDGSMANGSEFFRGDVVFFQDGSMANGSEFFRGDRVFLRRRCNLTCFHCLLASQRSSSMTDGFEFFRSEPCVSQAAAWPHAPSFFKVMPYFLRETEKSVNLIKREILGRALAPEQNLRKIAVNIVGEVKVYFWGRRCKHHKLILFVTHRNWNLPCGVCSGPNFE